MRKEIINILMMLVIAIFCLSSAILMVYFTTSGTYKIRNVATMITIDFDVTWDITGTHPCTVINWETLTPGSNKNITVFIRNTGNTNMFGSFNTTDWIPVIASNYITLTWNFGNISLSSHRVRRTTFTLSISPYIKDITDFSFNIVITGKQA